MAICLIIHKKYPFQFPKYHEESVLAFFREIWRIAIEPSVMDCYKVAKKIYWVGQIVVGNFTFFDLLSVNVVAIYCLGLSNSIWCKRSVHISIVLAISSIFTFRSRNTTSLTSLTSFEMVKCLADPGRSSFSKEYRCQVFAAYPQVSVKKNKTILKILC